MSPITAAFGASRNAPCERLFFVFFSKRYNIPDTVSESPLKRKTKAVWYVYERLGVSGLQSCITVLEKLQYYSTDHDFHDIVPLR